MEEDAGFHSSFLFTGERREIAINSAGIPLTIHHPLNATKGTVLIVPGWSGPRSGPADILVYFAANLARSGWTAIRMDLPARGDASGDFINCGLDEMIDATIKTAATCGGMPISYLLGMCSGSNVSLGVATRLKQKIHQDPEACDNRLANNVAVIALSALPFQPSRSPSFDRLRRWKNIKQYAAKATSPQTWARLLKGDIDMRRVKKNVTSSEAPTGGGRNLKDSARDIERELLGWKASALFVWGGGDEEAPPARAHYEKLHEAGMGTPGKTYFCMVDGANHNFYSQAWREELFSKIIDFIAK